MSGHNFSRFIGDGSLSRSRKGDTYSLVTNIKDIPRGTKFLRVVESEAVYPLLYRRGEGNHRICLFNEEHGHVVITGDPLKIDTMFSLVEKAPEPAHTEAKPKRYPKKKPIAEVAEPDREEPPLVVKGEKGDRGPIGPMGFPGDKGEKGDQGEIGPQGEKGDKGDQGEIGPQGEKGERGEPGEKGDQGEIGPQGEKGDKGDRGEPGEKGEPGRKGERGEKGDQGENGDKGDPGERGIKGLRGERGPQGIQGLRGERGLQGIQGEQGKPGEKGEPGEKGDKGDKGDSPIVSAQYPLILSEDNVISLDSKNLLERLQKVFTPLTNPNLDLSKFDWLAASGGGVGVKWNGSYVRSTINDIDFRGNGISVKQAGGGVIVDLSGLVAAGGSAVGTTADIGVLYLKGNTLATPIGSINGRSVVAGNYQTGILSGFTKDSGTNSLRYTGVGGRFHVTITFNFYDGNQNTCGFYIGCNRNISSGLSADADRISESEIYANSANPSAQPVASAIQTVLDLNTDDRLFMIAQNKNATTSITVEFMKMVVAPVTKLVDGISVSSINGLSGAIGITAGQFIEITQSGNTLTISGLSVIHGGVF
jgi:hypothetical protein